MRYYLESPSTDPYFNLALEQFVFDHFDLSHSYCILWQNENTIVVGKYQNTLAEINSAYVREHGIKVVRRLSGGGAVYHDLGNLNFTFITDHRNDAAFDFSTFCTPVIKALHSIGVTAEVNGRNDMTIDGKKFSGNAQYIKSGRVMHHGTILFDSDLTVLSAALCPPKDKMESKSIKSVVSRVTNVKPYAPEHMTTRGFWNTLRTFLTREYNMQPYRLNQADLASVQALKELVYDSWDWNYGASPQCSILRERRVEGIGKLEVHMDVDNGRIVTLAFRGDYFGERDAEELAEVLIGCELEEMALRARLRDIDVGIYFHNLDLETLCTILQ